MAVASVTRSSHHVDLKSRVDRNNRTTSYTYDALNRVRTVTYADGSIVTMTWDGGNRLTRIDDTANGTITRQYDGLDRLKQEASPQGEVDYQYDSAGRRTQMTVNGANPIIYDYDSANRLRQIARGTSVVGLGYDVGNRRTSVTYPNGIVATLTYDDGNQLQTLSYDRGSTHVGDLSYSYDGAGRRLTQSGSLARLLVPSTVNGAVYDAANRMQSWGSQSFTYDNNGNLTSNGSSTYGWNVRNQLVSVSDGGAGLCVPCRASRRLTCTTVLAPRLSGTHRSLTVPA
jgi:YD repeat-containing protein